MLGLMLCCIYFEILIILEHGALHLYFALGPSWSFYVDSDQVHAQQPGHPLTHVQHGEPPASCPRASLLNEVSGTLRTGGVA